MSAAYRYKDERVGFCRSLWLVLNGARVNEAVTYLVTEDYDPEGGLREVWTRVKPGGSGRNAAWSYRLRLAWERRKLAASETWLRLWGIDGEPASEPSAASLRERWVKPADPVRVLGECGHSFEVPRDEYGDGSVYCGGCGEVVVYERCLTCGSLDCQAHEGPTIRHREVEA